MEDGQSWQQLHLRTRMISESIETFTKTAKVYLLVFLFMMRQILT